ncbi:MAG TPA: phage holin family protein [Chloroflexota bacterium]|jgi:putative membrane protein|nr:phage holin family protein [Chloroflexota bacterium]
MSHLLAQIVVNGIMLWIVAYIVPGISFTGGVVDLLILGLIFGIVNWIIKPLVVILTLPLTILTLGLFALIINALMLLLTGALAPNYHVAGFLPALLGSIVVSILSMFINRFVK